MVPVFFMIWLVQPALLHAQQERADRVREASAILGRRGEVYFSFPRNGITAACKLVSVDRVKAGRVFAYANRAQFGNFLSLDLPFEVHTPPSERSFLQKKHEAFGRASWDSYPSFGQYTDMMHGFASAHPGICRLDTIGFSVLGREILAVRISGDPGDDRPRAVFFYTSTMHGDEVAGYVLMLRLIDTLLSGYGGGGLPDRLIDNCVIWINPLANPDGTYFGGDETVYGATRYNFGSVDLNRNFPDPEDGPHPDGYNYQIETLSMMEFMQEIRPALSANLHGGAEVINYPWDTWDHIHADDDWYRMISKDYADTVMSADSGYFRDFTDGITRGILWYEVDGGRMDYVNYFLGGREVTMELSDEKVPGPEQLSALWDYNREALLRYIEQALYGLSGRVTDSTTGAPLLAQIEVEGHDRDHSGVRSDPLSGNWFRFLKEGSYDLRFTADGYDTRMVSGVEVFDRQRTRLDVKMVPSMKGPAGKEVQNKMNDLGAYITGRELCFSLGSPGVVRLQVCDLAGRPAGEVVRRNGTTGRNRIRLDPALPQGFYLFRLRANGRETVLKHFLR